MQCAMAHPRPITGHVASKDLSLPALNLSRFPSSHKDPLFFLDKITRSYHSSIL